VILAAPILGIPLALVFFGFIVRNFRNAMTGECVQKGELVANVLVPLIIFSVVSWLALA
jgi:hypothetical protein